MIHSLSKTDGKITSKVRNYQFPLFKGQDSALFSVWEIKRDEQIVVAPKEYHQ